MTGDFNWDVAIVSYIYPEELYQKKYCRTKNNDGTLNTEWAAPCNEKTYEPYKTKESMPSNETRKFPGKLIVDQGNVIKNFFAKREHESGGISYEFVTLAFTRTKTKYNCFR
jgi:hypothetical protein